MQEKPVISKTLRKVAAIGTGVAMLGMTLTGALAQDATLADFPSAFTSNTVVVVGSAADPADNVAASDVSFALGGSSSGTTTTTTTTTTTSSSSMMDSLEFDDGRLEDIPLNRSLIDATDGFRANLTDNDISGFADDVLQIDIGDVDDDYNYHEELRLTSDARVETGLTYDDNRDEDWEDNIFIPMKTNAMSYYFVFDESLRAGNYLSNATQTDPIDITFLGRNFELIGVANDPDSITVNVGEEFRLNSGDCVVVSGTRVCLKGATTTKAEVDIGGAVEVISEDSSRTRNGVEVRVEDVFDEEGVNLDSATLIIGETVDGQGARKTFNDGEEFIGEDENDPIWVWDFANLNTANPTFGVTLDLNIDDPEESDNPAIKHPLYEGDYLCLPWNYACLVFEAIEQPDDDSQEYVVEDSTRDLYFSTADADAGNVNRTNAKVLLFKAVGANDDGFTAGGTDTDSVYIEFNSTGTGISLYRKEQDGSKAIRFGTANANVSQMNAFQLDYKSTNLPVHIYTGDDVLAAGTADDFNLTIAELGANGAFNITLYVEESAAGEITYLGHSDSDTSQANDVVYQVPGRTFDISGFEENTRTAGGIRIEDPDSNAPGDRFRMWVPTDVTDFKIDVRVAQPVGVSSGSGSVVESGAPVNGVASRLDTEVLADLTSWNVVSVGGPAINQVTAELMGLTFPAYGAASGINPGEAVLEVRANGNNWALIAAGYEKDNTRAAGLVLKNYADYADQLSGTSAVVRGLEATGITVA